LRGEKIMVEMTPQEILEIPMEQNDAEAATIKEYLKALLRRVLIEEDGFSGKRPFGNSGWICELEHALVKANVIQGDIDENGYLDDCDSETALVTILNAIAAL
jgi:hypothetical protein